MKALAKKIPVTPEAPVAAVAALASPAPKRPRRLNTSPGRRSLTGLAGHKFAEKLRQLEEAQSQAVEIAKVVGDGELRLEEASTKLAIQLIMEMLVVMKELKGRDSTQVVKVLDVLARLQTSNVLREKLKADFRRAVERARDGLLAGVRQAVRGDTRLRADLVRLINAQAKELLSR